MRDKRSWRLTVRSAAEAVVDGLGACGAQSLIVESSQAEYRADFVIETVQRLKVSFSDGESRFLMAPELLVPTILKRTVHASDDETGRSEERPGIVGL